jgi:hypothetical protein
MNPEVQPRPEGTRFRLRLAQNTHQFSLKMTIHLPDMKRGDGTLGGEKRIGWVEHCSHARAAPQWAGRGGAQHGGNLAQLRTGVADGCGDRIGS